ncbi:hypothetical protein ACEWY4_001243 [Coilia grayii]|uniref:SCAN box domain-containing protein n=1 Tax=Coilia grayii TaxID=363190 RepID=A0ABD1KZ05_9TELE
MEDRRLTREDQHDSEEQLPDPERWLPDTEEQLSSQGNEGPHPYQQQQQQRRRFQSQSQQRRFQSQWRRFQSQSQRRRFQFQFQSQRRRFQSQWWRFQFQSQRRRSRSQCQQPHQLQHHRRFREPDVRAGETPRELYNRLKDLFDNWIRPSTKTVEEVAEVLILEQFMRTLAPDIRVWVKEREPQDAQRAAELVESFMAARNGLKRFRHDPQQRPPARGKSDLVTGLVMVVVPGLPSPTECLHRHLPQHLPQHMSRSGPEVTPRAIKPVYVVTRSQSTAHTDEEANEDSPDSLAWKELAFCDADITSPARVRPKKSRSQRRWARLVGTVGKDLPVWAADDIWEDVPAAPLSDLTRKSGTSQVTWGPEQEKAFVDLKAVLCNQPVLQSPDFSLPFTVQTDASGVGLGAVLLQGEGDQQKPVAYISHKLFPRESRYAVTELECLAVKWALDSLKYYLLGRDFILETDHRALQWLDRMKDSNARITRWFLALQPYRFTVQYRAGQQNAVADFLSRHPVGVTSEGEGSVHLCSFMNSACESKWEVTHRTAHTLTQVWAVFGAAGGAINS